MDQAILELRDLPTRIKDVAEVIILLFKKNGRRNDEPRFKTVLMVFSGDQ